MIRRCIEVVYHLLGCLFDPTKIPRKRAKCSLLSMHHLYFTRDKRHSYTSLLMMIDNYMKGEDAKTSFALQCNDNYTLCFAY